MYIISHGPWQIVGVPKAFRHLDLEHGALQFADIGQLLGHHNLRQLRDEKQQIGDALAGNGRRWDQRHVATHVLVLVVPEEAKCINITTMYIWVNGLL